MPRLSHVAVVAVFAFAGAAVPASAWEENQRVVRYGELDLNSRAGADTLIRRIDNAAESVCSARQGPRSVVEASRERACARETTDTAIEDVGHPNVSTRYYGGTGYVEEDVAYYDPAYGVYVKPKGAD